MKIYHFDPATGAYTGANTASPDPLEWDLAQQAVYVPLKEAAHAAFATAIAAAAAALNAVQGAEETPTERQLGAARARHDQALAEAAQVRDAALAEALAAYEAVEPPRWLVPANATTEEPPEPEAGQQAVWTEGGWQLQDLPEVEVTAAPPLPEIDPASTIRAERDRRIRQLRPLVERHQDELALGMTTTLSAEAYQALLEHIQALRDITDQPGFPDNIVWPASPAAFSSPVEA